MFSTLSAQGGSNNNFSDRKNKRFILLQRDKSLENAITIVPVIIKYSFQPFSVRLLSIRSRSLVHERKLPQKIKHHVQIFYHISSCPS
mmetsp:Transcript_48019/g.93806  ORF Transcript_48019/g.93806 Transcript_48019/m.93806 type:complete len:88 (-) Transcript_48019:452-715(-)